MEGESLLSKARWSSVRLWADSMGAFSRICARASAVQPGSSCGRLPGQELVCVRAAFWASQSQRLLSSCAAWPLVQSQVVLWIAVGVGGGLLLLLLLLLVIGVAWLLSSKSSPPVAAGPSPVAAGPYPPR